MKTRFCCANFVKQSLNTFMKLPRCSDKLKNDLNQCFQSHRQALQINSNIKI